MSAVLENGVWRYQCRARFADGSKTKIHGSSHHSCNTEAGAKLAEAEHLLWLRSQMPPPKGKRLRFKPSAPGTGGAHVSLTPTDTDTGAAPSAEPAPTAITVREWLATYLTSIKGTIAASSYDDKVKCIDQHLLKVEIGDGILFADVPLLSVTTKVIDDLRNALRERQNPKIKHWEQPLEPATVNKFLKYTQTAIRAAKEYGHPIKFPKVTFLQADDPDWDWLEPAELVTLLGAARGMWRVIASFAAGTGLRRSELRALRQGDVNLEGGTVYVQRAYVEGVFKLPKSGKKRVVDIPGNVLVELRRWLAAWPHDLVFCREDGAPLTTGVMTAQLDKMTREAGLRRIGWHVLRHTFASHLIAAGVDLETVRDYMGHSDIKITQRYIHRSRNRTRDAINRLDALRVEAADQLALAPAAPVEKLKALAHRAPRMKHPRPKVGTKATAEAPFN